VLIGVPIGVGEGDHAAAQRCMGQNLHLKPFARRRRLALPLAGPAGSDFFRDRDRLRVGRGEFRLRRETSAILPTGFAQQPCISAYSILGHLKGNARNASPKLSTNIFTAPTSVVTPNAAILSTAEATRLPQNVRC
jgi:hypothetical protein